MKNAILTTGLAMGILAAIACAHQQLPDVRANTLNAEDAEYFHSPKCAGLTYNECFRSMDQ